MNCTLKVCCGAIICGIALSASAQQITVRLMQGKSGKPIVDQNVTLEFDNKIHASEIVVRTNRNGEAVVAIPAGASKVSLREGPKKGKEPYRVAYGDCNAGGLVLLDINQIKLNGFVPQNECGKFKAQLRPGTIVFYAQTIPWHVPDMQ